MLGTTKYFFAIQYGKESTAVNFDVRQLHALWHMVYLDVRQLHALWHAVHLDVRQLHALWHAVHLDVRQFRTLSAARVICVQFLA